MSNPSAAILVIGDEILSGRTRDSNLHYLSCELTKIGINLQEARIIPDNATEIINAVKWLSSKYNYLFTSGGIGPTHDDITADCIATAFETEINIRVDFLLKNGLKTCFLEVKNVTLSRQEKIAEFPDTVTERGAKHLKELSNIVDKDTRAMVLYLVQRSDCNYFKIANDLDPIYADASIFSQNSGVEFVCYGVNFLQNGIELGYNLELINKF